MSSDDEKVFQGVWDTLQGNEKLTVVNRGENVFIQLDSNTETRLSKSALMLRALNFESVVETLNIAVNTAAYKILHEYYNRIPTDIYSRKPAPLIVADLQDRIWHSLVRVTALEENEQPTRYEPTILALSTGISIDVTDEHLYILTCFHFWESLVRDKKKLIRDIKFSEQLRDSLGLRGIDDNKLVSVQIKCEQLIERSLKQVLLFNVSPEIFFDCNKDWDYVILKLPKPADSTLIKPTIRYDLYNETTPVKIFGFPGSLFKAFDEPMKEFMIVSSSIANVQNKIFVLDSLSCPGLSGSAVVFNTGGSVLGYLGGALDSSNEKNSQFGTYAYMMHGLPKSLPRLSPPSSPDDKAVTISKNKAISSTPSSTKKNKN